MQGYSASDVWILTSLPSNFEYTIRNFTLNRILNRPWLAENWHLYSRQTLKDKKSLMSAIQNIRRNFVLLRFPLLNQLSGARSCIWSKCSCGASPCWGFCGVYPAVQFYVGGKLSTRRGLISDWHTQRNPHFVFLKSWNCFPTVPLESLIEIGIWIQNHV